jgi:hypothetical protein
MKGKKVGQTIMLEYEPAIPDGTEVDVELPDGCESQRETLLKLASHPDFGPEIGKVR